MVDQFYIWVSPHSQEQRTGMRAFPEWFVRTHPAGVQIERQYESAVKEWGYFLDEASSAAGLFPGQLDLCLWGTLGKSNFLHTIPGKIKNASLSTAKTTSSSTGVILYDKLLTSTMEVFVFRMIRS